MSKNKTLSIGEAYNQGVHAYETGELNKAVSVLNQVLKAAPKYAPAHQLLGVIAFQTGQTGPAENAMREAIRLQPDNAGFLSNFIEVLRTNGKAEEAIRAGKHAVQLDPGSAIAHSNLGLAYYDLGDLIDAEASQKKALALQPDLVAAYNNLGSIARDKGDRTAAISFYRQVLDLRPDHLESVNNLISVLIETEAVDEARELTERYVKKGHASAELHRNRGRLHVLHCEWDEAERCFRMAISLDETKPESYVGLAQVLAEKNLHELALLEAEKAQRIDHSHAPAYHYIAVCKSYLGDMDAGFVNYQKALELKPDFTAAMIALGYLKMEQGNFDSARHWFNKAAEEDKARLNAQIALVKLDRVTQDNPDFKALEAALPDADKMLPEQSVSYHYALGKCYEDLKRYETAFEHFAKGAAIKRSIIDYDADQIEETADNLIGVFTPALIEKLRKSALHSDQPIFVVGMPRSGTTLTESILASHTDVFGAGELSYLHNLFADQLRGGNKKTGSLIASLSEHGLTQRAQRYVQQLDAHAPCQPHIVDKMPANFLMVGLIHAVLPNARIVHIARNPFDTCLSCFTRVFQRSQYHSYDQVELGRYFKAYVRVMQHWNELLPADSFLTVHYENLVEDIEFEARRMIAFCGLKWDERCLDFHKGERRVRTASVQQVRQPLYKSSKEKWRNYEAQLAPLIQTIGEARIRF
ncbi:tetratricopeptide repeat-containing sulfotransferase family protein [uncultured Ruegeria sp.]|uniref:tetratricopeptide repeat-containing sulfotransferase family protein n=1 Tax=uncultured Ruegeria sp. TaxID=259304 RepID=UPI00263A0B50|nr:tetratricopeptide repeat-containing sulfotransferase family protein [uncultured Ruegeria sp.]